MTAIKDAIILGDFTVVSIAVHIDLASLDVLNYVEPQWDSRLPGIRHVPLGIKGIPDTQKFAAPPGIKTPAFRCLAQGWVNYGAHSDNR